MPSTGLPPPGLPPQFAKQEIPPRTTPTSALPRLSYPARPSSSLPSNRRKVTPPSPPRPNSPTARVSTATPPSSCRRGCGWSGRKWWTPETDLSWRHTEAMTSCRGTSMTSQRVRTKWRGRPTTLMTRSWTKWRDCCEVMHCFLWRHNAMICFKNFGKSLYTAM